MGRQPQPPIDSKPLDRIEVTGGGRPAADSIGLAQAPLSITDVAGGQQPMNTGVGQP